MYGEIKKLELKNKTGKKAFSSKKGFLSSLPLLGAILLFIVLIIIALIVAFFIHDGTKIKPGAVESVSSSAFLNDVAKLKPTGKDVSAALDMPTFKVDPTLGVLAQSLYNIVHLDEKNNLVLQRFAYDGSKLDEVSTKSGVSLNSISSVLFLPHDIVILKTDVPTSAWTALASLDSSGVS